MSRVRVGPGAERAGRAGPGQTLRPLLDAARGAGDPGAPADRSEALAALVGRLQPTLARCLRSRVPDADPDLMADLLQEAALHIVEGVGSCRGSTDEQVRSWACVVAIRAGLAFLRSPRSGQRETRGALDLDAPAARNRAWAEWAAGPEPDGAEGRNPIRVLARWAADAHAALPPETAALVWDRVVDNVSWAEAGARLGTTASAAKRRFQRAQDAIRRRLWARAAALGEPDRSELLVHLRVLGARGGGAPDGATRVAGAQPSGAKRGNARSGAPRRASDHALDRAVERASGLAARATPTTGHD